MTEREKIKQRRYDFFYEGYMEIMYCKNEEWNFHYALSFVSMNKFLKDIRYEMESLAKRITEMPMMCGIDRNVLFDEIMNDYNNNGGAKEKEIIATVKENIGSKDSPCFISYKIYG